MSNAQTISHHWHEVAGKLRDKWSCLTADDIHAFNGNVEELVEKIARLTGETQEEVQRYIDHVSGNMAWMAEDLREKTTRAASQAMASARDGYQVARAEAGRAIRQYPAESLVFAFGLGLLSGLGLALLVHQRARPSAMTKTKGIARGLVHRFAGTLPDVRPEKLARYLGR